LSENIAKPAIGCDHRFRNHDFRRNSEFNSDYQRSLACQPKLPSSEGGGADRDRTDDLKLAKLALSQLSYGPGQGSED
jgi:hypothetical protein